MPFNADRDITRGIWAAGAGASIFRPDRHMLRPGGQPGDNLDLAATVVAAVTGLPTDFNPISLSAATRLGWLLSQRFFPPVSGGEARVSPPVQRPQLVQNQLPVERVFRAYPMTPPGKIMKALPPPRQGA